MLTKIQGRIVAFFSRPSVQSVVRHAITAAIAAAVPVYLAGGAPALVSAVGAVVVLRAVWAVLRPSVIEVAPDLDPVVPKAEEPAQPVVAA